MAFESDLRELLLWFPTTGKQFEQLVLLALEVTLGRRVWSARSGSQFGTDMGTGTDEWPRIQAEAKRYRDGKNLKKRDLLGELHEAATTHPNLDLWILATCAEVPHQLEKALLAAGKEWGIGVEIFDLSSSRYCKLPRLFASASREVSEFVQRNLGESAGREMVRLLKKARSSRMPSPDPKAQLLEATSLFDLVAGSARADLQNLLSNQHRARIRFSHHLQSEEFLERTDITAALDRWYMDPVETRHLLALCGDEGVGKTWAAAGWLARACEEHSLLPVMLPASQATSATTVSSWIAAYLHELFPNGGRERWELRVRRWLSVPQISNRLIVIFDGLNEQPTTDWRALLDQTFREDTIQVSVSSEKPELVTRFAVIVTCRGVFWDRKFAAVPGWVIQRLEVGPFSNEELHKYLSYHNRRPEEFSRDVWGLLRIPRFCDRVVKHYDRLIKSGDITRNRLLYEDWKDRYERRRDLQQFDDASFQCLMMELAEKALEGSRQYRERQIKDLLPVEGSEGVLVELQTGGIFREGGAGRLEVVPERLHLALGLLLVAQVAEMKGQPIEAVEELLASYLEPHGVDEHSAICAAAIFGATLRDDLPTAHTALLFENFFSLQNLHEDEWKRIRGYFPVLSEVYRELAETISREPERPRKAWEVVEWAYLRWCDDPELEDVIRQHCARWISFLPVESPWGRRDERMQAEYEARLQTVLGFLPQPGTVEVEGKSFTLIDSPHLHLIHNLVPQLLSARPLAAEPETLGKWALLNALDRGGSHDQSLRWLVRRLDSSATIALVHEIEAMLEVENPIWQEAAFHLAGMLPDGRAEAIQGRSSYLLRSNFDHSGAEDPCKTGIYYWLDEECTACLEREDVEPEAKATNISWRSCDPAFSLPPSCGEALETGLVEVLETLDGTDLHGSCTTSANIGVDRWEAAFARWVPDHFASFSTRFTERFIDSSLGGSSDAADGEKEERVAVELATRDLCTVSLLLGGAEFARLQSFWEGWAELPAKDRENLMVSGRDIDMVESEIFRCLLLLADRTDRVRLLIRRAAWGFNDLRIMDVAPLGLSPNDQAQFWEQLLVRPAKEVLSKGVFLALECSPVAEDHRSRLLEHAQSGSSDLRVFLSIIVLLSGDAEFLQYLVNSRFDVSVAFVSWKYWIPHAETFSALSLAEMEGIPAPLLSHLIAEREMDAASRGFSEMLVGFVDSGEEASRRSPWPEHGGYRSSFSFSLPAVRTALRANPWCLDALLLRLQARGSELSPISHSFWLYFVVAEHLLQESPAQALVLLDRLLKERYVDNFDGPGPHGLIRLMARSSRIAGITERLEASLDLCSTDTSLQGFALSFEAGEDSWLWGKIESDLKSARPLLVARALTLAGFAQDIPQSIQLLEFQLGSVAWWLETVRERSLRHAKRASWSQYWFREFLGREDPRQSWAAFRLFLRTTDRRYYTWVGSSLEEQGYAYRDDSRRMRHLRVNGNRIRDQIEKREKKKLAKTLCHSPIAESIFPWLKPWKLSPDKRRRLMTG